MGDYVFFFCNMDVRLPRLSTHRPCSGMHVLELKPSVPLGPLRTPGDRAPRGQISACVFAPQGTLDPALYPRPRFYRSAIAKPLSAPQVILGAEETPLPPRATARKVHSGTGMKSAAPLLPERNR